MITPAGGMLKIKPQGYTSCDFSGLPSPRYGSYVTCPAYSFSWPTPGPGWLPNFFLPLDAGMLRLPQLTISMPNTIAPGITSHSAHPAIRKQIFPAVFG